MLPTIQDKGNNRLLFLTLSSFDLVHRLIHKDKLFPDNHPLNNFLKQCCNTACANSTHFPDLSYRLDRPFDSFTAHNAAQYPPAPVVECWRSRPNERPRLDRSILSQRYVLPRENCGQTTRPRTRLMFEFQRLRHKCGYR